jgi:rod shape-determining protein MreC
LQQQLRLTDAERAQLADMQKLLHLDQQAQFRMVAARITAVGSSLGFESTATIDIGSRSGIKPDQTVIDGDGLVGRTLSVGPDTTTVLLGNDVNFHAGARLEGSEQIGVVDGGGRRPMSFRLLDSVGNIAVGQRLVTFGDIGNRPFVPEVPIGRITRVAPANGALTRTAVVAPYVRFTTLDIVAVVVAVPSPPRRDSLLPASPTPAPTPTVTVTVTASPGASSSRSPQGTPSPRPTPSTSRSA